MSINVICQSCHSRFTVSDKFAGKTGPCPKCKASIRVPAKSEEVIVHAPDEFGPKNAAGESVLKPIERKQNRISAVTIVGIVGAVILVFVIAFLVGRMYRSDSGTNVPLWLLGTGAVLVGPAISLAGYSFLRNDELEPYRGAALLLRVTVCGVVYALVWGAYAYAVWMIFGADSPELFALVFIIPVMVLVGSLAPLAGLDLDFTSACIHFGLYLGVCVILRLVMGLSAF